MTAPGSYAFLTEGEGGAMTAVTTYEGLRDDTRLVIHKSDAGGTSWAAFYETVQAGDERCWQRYRVTEVLADPPGEPPRKLFAIEDLPFFFSGCSGPISDGQDAIAVEMRWSPPAARPGADGIAVMLLDQPVEGGATYRPAPFTTLVIDVPALMRLVRYTGLVVSGSGYTLGLMDVQSGSYLILDLHTGEQLKRRILTREGDARDVDALFDKIVESARRQPSPR